MDLVPGLLVADRFRLERVLGKGGMGAVWLAHHTGLDVPCAVKFIHAEVAASTEIRARFQREAKAAAQLRSPHVVQILDHGVWEGAPYMAMELLEGEDLAARLRREATLSPEETLALVSQVGRALTKAHAAGLVHRDLKPENIFLVRDDEGEVAKVLDFGIAKTTITSTDRNTKTGELLGTPYYMSPEQARGNHTVDHRSDLWALAIVVYECLTGTLPFRSDALGDLLAKIMFEPIPTPSSVAKVPPGFDAWWGRAVQRDPEQRFQSAKAMIDALGVALGLGVPASTQLGLRSPGVMGETGMHPAQAAAAQSVSDDDMATLSRLAPIPPGGPSEGSALGMTSVAYAVSKSRASLRYRHMPAALAGFALTLAGGMGVFYALHRPPEPAAASGVASAQPSLGAQPVLVDDGGSTHKPLADAPSEAPSSPSPASSHSMPASAPEAGHSAPAASASHADVATRALPKSPGSSTAGGPKPVQKKDPAAVPTGNPFGI